MVKAGVLTATLQRFGKVRTVGKEIGVSTAAILKPENVKSPEIFANMAKYGVVMTVISLNSVPRAVGKSRHAKTAAMLLGGVAISSMKIVVWLPVSPTQKFAEEVQLSAVPQTRQPRKFALTANGSNLIVLTVVPETDSVVTPPVKHVRAELLLTRPKLQPERGDTP